MDPTKPILDLYTVNESYSRDRERASKQTISHHSSQNKNSHLASAYNNSRNNKSNYRVEPSYQQLKEKYQDLYQAYHDRSEKLSDYETEKQTLKSENSKLRAEIDRLMGHNDELHGTLLGKNNQLEQTYRKLQDQVRGGSRMRNTTYSNQIAIDKLEQGLREAITSNYDILRESALSELRQYLH